MIRELFRNSPKNIKSATSLLCASLASNPTGMRKAFLSLALFATALTLPLRAQVKQDLKNAGEDTKDATVVGAKKTGHAIKKGATTSTHAVKDGATTSTHAVKSGVHKTATKVSDHTQDTSTHP